MLSVPHKVLETIREKNFADMSLKMLYNNQRKLFIRNPVDSNYYRAVKQFTSENICQEWSQKYLTSQEFFLM